MPRRDEEIVDSFVKASRGVAQSLTSATRPLVERQEPGVVWGNDSHATSQRLAKTNSGLRTKSCAGANKEVTRSLDTR